MAVVTQDRGQAELYFDSLGPDHNLGNDAGAIMNYAMNLLNPGGYDGPAPPAGVGGTIYVAPGHYLCQTPVTHYPYVRVRGSRRGLTSFHAPAGISAPIWTNLHQGGDSGKTDSDMTLENLTFDGNAAGQSSVFDLMSWWQVLNLWLYNVSFRNFKGRCLSITQPLTNNGQVNTNVILRDVLMDGSTASDAVEMCLLRGLQDSTLDGCWFMYGAQKKSGVLIALPNGVTVNNCHVRNNGGGPTGGAVFGTDTAYGMWIDGALYASVVNSDFYANGSSGLYISGDADPGTPVFGEAVAVVGCVFAGNYGRGIDLAAAGTTKQTRTQVAACTIENNQQSGIGIAGADHTTIVGNVIARNAQAGAANEGGIYFAGGPDIDAIVADNNIYDNQGTPTQVYGVNLGTLGAASIVKIANNVIKNATTAAIALGTGGVTGTINDNDLTVANGAGISGTGTQNLRIRTNDGANPVGSVTTPGFPATTVWVQNTTGYDVLAHINFSASGAFTGTHLYTNNKNSTAGAWDYGAAPSQAEFVVPIGAGAWFRCDYSAGAPTWKWQGV